MSTPSSDRSVLHGVTLYHWLVVIIASSGWLFDCMDQRFFVLARQPALVELVTKEQGGQAAQKGAVVAAPASAIANLVKQYSGQATTAMILGWATGGILFGLMSDKWGRVKTMVLTLLVYAGFTGLSGIAQTSTQFILFRFPVGLGIGGMFGAATTLVAESVPGNFRSVALGSLQSLSALGNLLGSLISLQIPPGQADYWNGFSGWRVLSFVGIIPAVLVVPMLFFLREPEAWQQARAAARSGPGTKAPGDRIAGWLRDAFRPLGELFGRPRWRRHAIIGLLLGVSGMIGLWGIAFYSPELITEVLRGAPQPIVDKVRGWGTIGQDIGSFAGMMTFTVVAASVGRRKAFFGAFLLCLVTVPLVFHSLRQPGDAYWMLPMMGFATLSLFAGYSIYFPELFPTRLRGTGVGFCYNTVRYLAAPAPMLFGYLTTQYDFRAVATGMSAIFLVGMIALIWAPETKGQPLPED